MFEFTMGGLWFRWGALDRRGKWLAGSSCLAAGLAATPLGFALGEWAFALGHATGGGNPLPSSLASGSFTPAMAWWSVGFGILSAILWWRFSLQQDEMFNRVQNWALGTASFWTMALVTLWAILTFAGAAPPVSIGAILLIYYAALFGFWLVAVRRWA